MERLNSGHLQWNVGRGEVWEAVGAVHRNAKTDDERELWEWMVAELSDIDPPQLNYPQLDDDGLELLMKILEAECDAIHGQSYPYHSLNNVRREIEYFLSGNP
ncbi:hypothetical protein HUG10_21280 (plasmid) [Halorarum halophilum]|uniref:Uncharacterized protein n=1 Tax=Halorarum halophilum TaxID=2743090 RepID=A0A7D5KQB3_9EURY|nr:hypothetical protein [Halobaculum halophilum]QLG30122.1 hypothetical protein HUG10_21280 [Halobaculum halophilum]